MMSNGSTFVSEAWDNNFDGYDETIVYDFDGDGWVDAWDVDTDGDGYVDEYFWDYNEDGYDDYSGQSLWDPYGEWSGDDYYYDHTSYTNGYDSISTLNHYYSNNDSPVDAGTTSPFADTINGDLNEGAIDDWNTFQADGVSYSETLVDANADGYADYVTSDEDGDGYQETVSEDLDGDGYIDTVSMDRDEDGYAETVYSDTDGDGYVDEIATDADGDGIADAVTLV
ncbi:hypothetical protein JRG19_02905 [Pseudoclavibacter alba]|uniref:EF-hand domain-containing protein n=1 Tax=Pseudoclavibacter albus TaxID=272241 RepID=A0ABT2HWT8_9MICO|nr:hypothetical protein [Pseudoclavibacter alba]MBN6777500.1 hypothetical protein [Pseudoclavibacter alba]MCT2042785.1 hypothetical protein [Pseudoclavibacter alba]